MTGELHPPQRLIRFALDPDGVVTPDLGAELPGRGAWVTAARSMVIAAAKRGHFNRAFKAEARLPAGVSPEAFADAVECGLAARSLAALGLARRAGAGVAGFEKVEAALKGAGAGVLVIAADAAADGTDKLIRLAGTAPVIRAFDARELARAIGCEGVVYAALRTGREAARTLRELDRLSGFRTVYGGAGEAISAAE